ncbi:NAD-dependent succinate-semialdehyde dehydrogenase [Oceanospirillum linum]|uniref:Succinate-semialdehyde dehydrogenase (NADP(+)) n=1 Tax=Oceanospirillum linum TaxID=966 RepID=A0A1T1HAB4_OCELI|nr:NAD-dependent succinate-semialdehyde dehydrogenase [Oceanospirillum linum]OOV86755.1 succinate-semialdehyde dehydrogenase (NADP(+)) [Oceanospirillum linum]SEG23519.1 succinate-semialdehyde dehydrogenase / glutarate-semialdehyde dehydrogenase [Oleiphilus messinensis]SMP25602.1 succinate-semialdehyde dehydrogenase / glutarate-semialdehyde dehydrogenase [Oceanospirillum linum]
MLLKLKDSQLLKTQAYINGEWVNAQSAQTFPVKNPATGLHIDDVADLGAEETRQAIEAADKAMVSWKAKTAKERSVILKKWFDLMVEAKEDLGLLMTIEQGKPLKEAVGEVMYGASFIEWFAEEGRRAYGDVIPTHAADKRIVTVKQPIGVVAAITPWNFPVAMITRKAAPALAAGCTIVIKPSEETPFCALAMAELAHRAGVPAGVLNVVTGTNAAAIGGELTSSPIVRKLSFTGSTPVGKLLMKQCADTVKKTSMELGGNAPFIVFDDADIDAAVEGAIASKYRNAGQTCVCANRLLVQAGVHDEFSEKLAKRVEQMQIGNGTTPGVEVGPLINKAAIDKVDTLVKASVEQGAKILTGGERHAHGELFYTPTILSNVTQEMPVFTQEIFGPVAPIVRFETEEEAIEIANNTPFGLAAYFYSETMSRVWRVSEGLEYGMVAVNDGILSTEVAPFGGVKESGTGREGSKYGLDEYLEIKYMLMGGIR